jgi:2-methylcitrate dehydratase PrpD
VAGYEVTCRLAKALQLSEHGGHGFHSTGTCGVFAAAAVASRLLGLTADQIVHALGIAGSQTAASLEYRTEGAWTKRLHPGWAAHSGIIAAELARSGFTGPRRILEGRAGFLRSYSDNPRVEGMLDGLGADYQILRVAIKPHAACRYSQGAIDAMLKLVLEHDVHPRVIERVKVGMFKAAFTSVVEPLERKRRPRAMMDAQFSVFFAAAASALWRRVTVAEYQAERMTSPDVHAMIDRVEPVHDPELDALYPKLWPTTVEIALRDGRRLEARVDHLKGDPENPVSWDELVAKFNGLTAPILGGAVATEVVKALRDFEGRPVRSVMQLLRKA